MNHHGWLLQERKYLKKQQRCYKRKVKVRRGLASSSLVSSLGDIFSVIDTHTVQATSMLENRRSWEGCSTKLVALTKNQKWRTKGRAVRLAKAVSAGRGSLTVPPRNASGK